MQFETCALEKSRRCIVSVISSIDVNVAMRQTLDTSLAVASTCLRSKHGVWGAWRASLCDEMVGSASRLHLSLIV